MTTVSQPGRGQYHQAQLNTKQKKGRNQKNWGPQLIV